MLVAGGTPFLAMHMYAPISALVTAAISNCDPRTESSATHEARRISLEISQKGLIEFNCQLALHGHYMIIDYASLTH